MEFDNLTLYKEYPNYLSDKHTLRIYTTIEGVGDELRYRWHVGFPEQIVPECLRVLLCTTVYWAKEPWTERDGFCVWWLAILSKTRDLPKNEINSWVKFLLGQYNQCLNFFKRAAEKMKQE